MYHGLNLIGTKRNKFWIPIILLDLETKESLLRRKKKKVDLSPSEYYKIYLKYAQY
jgi:hypothetical protein